MLKDETDLPDPHIAIRRLKLHEQAPFMALQFGHPTGIVHKYVQGEIFYKARLTVLCDLCPHELYPRFTQNKNALLDRLFKSIHYIFQDFAHTFNVPFRRRRMIHMKPNPIHIPPIPIPFTVTRLLHS